MKLLILIGVLAAAQAQFNLGGNPFNAASKLTPGYLDKPVGIAKGVVNTAKDTASAVLDAAFSDFTSKFKKTYKSAEEELRRKEIFIANRAKILAFDENFANLGFVQKLNDFADLLNNEFNEALNGFNRKKTLGHGQKPAGNSSAVKPSANVKPPTEVDWRKNGAVSPVKNQNLCAACWAFAAAGAIEGHSFRKTGKLVELSPQHLIDCTQKYGNDGCKGGLTDPAYNYVKESEGISLLDKYPYEAKNGDCRFKKDHSGAKDSGFVYIDEGDEAGLEAAVATLGPVSAAIDASPESFQFYSDGVYYEPKCKSGLNDLNHAVLIVGYGVDPDGKKYWLVKNSYGPDWGKGGYIKMAKDKNNHCGIATYANYPLV